MRFLSEKKEANENEKKEIVVSKKKTPATARPPIKPTALAPSAPLNLWQSFDDVFERFRQDFQTLLLPSRKALENVLTALPETRIPAVDLQDRGKDYLLKVEMPGFKKEDIDIEAFEDAVEISGTAGWKYDKKKEKYICKERACESFYRSVQLPEDIKVDGVQADLKDGVLEIVMAKKAPKQRKKVTLK